MVLVVCSTLVKKEKVCERWVRQAIHHDMVVVVLVVVVLVMVVLVVVVVVVCRTLGN